MRSFRILILTAGLLVITSLVYAEPQDLQSTSWIWAEKDTLVNYSFGPENKAVAKIILTKNNFGYQMTKENCHFYIPFVYQVKGDLLYASLSKRNEVQVSQISFAPEKKLQTQEVEYFIKTSSAISGEHEERILGAPQFLERVNY